jgi:hypothetical protein
VRLCDFGHGQEMELSRAPTRAQRSHKLLQRSTRWLRVCAKEGERIPWSNVCYRSLEKLTYSETTKTVILIACRDAQGQLGV